MSMNILSVLKKSFAAGVMISIGASIFLSVDNHIIGAILFSIGLFTICVHGMSLFTGKVGDVGIHINKLPDEAYKDYSLKARNYRMLMNTVPVYEIFIIWFGNLIGCIVTSIIVRLAKPQLHEVAINLATIKIQTDYYMVAISGFMCGILMFLAVYTYRKSASDFTGIIAIVLCVTVFILCGFEHSIADMSYLVFAIDSINDIVGYIIFILIVSISNALGAKTIKFLIK